jgi:hypothetical protein
MRERVREPDQYARLDKEDHRVENDAAKVGAAGIDCRREDEIQRQMMQRDRCRAGDNRPIVAISNQACQRRKEVHVHVDLPGMSRELEDQHRHAGHQGDGKDQAG